MKVLKLCIFVLGLITLSFSGPQADDKSFVWTYEYITTSQGELELENYLDFKAPRWSDKSTAAWFHQIELEYGITKSWDVALYQVFSQTNSEGYKFNQMKLRTRIKFLGEEKLLVNPMLYLEYKRPSNISAPNEIEGKLILAKEVKKLNLVGNFILEKKLISNSEWEKGYALGVSYRILAAVKGGMEIVGNFESGLANQFQLGPTFSFAAKNFFMAVGALWGANNQSDDLRFRYILGFDL